MTIVVSILAGIVTAWFCIGIAFIGLYVLDRFMLTHPKILFAAVVTITGAMLGAFLR